jgi:hypothetical protein
MLVLDLRLHRLQLGVELGGDGSAQMLLNVPTKLGSPAWTLRAAAQGPQTQHRMRLGSWPELEVAAPPS